MNAGYARTKPAIVLPFGASFAMLSGCCPTPVSALSGFLNRYTMITETIIVTIFTHSRTDTPLFSTMPPMIIEVTAKLADPSPRARPYIILYPAF